MLIHREYASGVPARLIIEYGKVTTYNASRPQGFGALSLETFAPYPKNPVIGAFFREIDRADELGSGMRNMVLYGKKYGGENPQLIEGDIFRMIISVPEFGEKESKTEKSGTSGNQQQKSIKKASEKTSEKILKAILANEEITIAELAEPLGVTTRAPA
jgi:ATP-dependent DNA helicase RecG